MPRLTCAYKARLFCLALFYLMTSDQEVALCQWDQVYRNSDRTVQSIASLDSFVVVGTGTGVLISNDFGDSFKDVENLANKYCSSVAIVQREGGVRIFAATSEAFYFSDDGNTWTTVDFPFTTPHTVAAVPLPKGELRMFGGTAYGIYASTDTGRTWTESNEGLDIKSNALAFTESNGLIFSSGNYQYPKGGVFLSTDKGASWNVIHKFESTSRKLVSVSAGGVLVASRKEGIWSTTDSGATWNTSNSGLPGADITYLAARDKIVLATCHQFGIFYSSDQGTNWIGVNQGLSDLSGSVVHLSDTFAYYGGEGIGLWRRPINEFAGQNNVASRDSSLKSRLVLFPNPLKGKLRIAQFSQASLADEVRVYSSSGGLIYESSEVPSQNIEIDVSSWPAGNYNVVISAEGKSHEGRFVKNP
jgi:photosystem II stability/assembly factor-like uncharacterized protein